MEGWLMHAGRPPGSPLLTSRPTSSHLPEAVRSFRPQMKRRPPMLDVIIGVPCAPLTFPQVPMLAHQPRLARSPTADSHSVDDRDGPASSALVIPALPSQFGSCWPQLPGDSKPAGALGSESRQSSFSGLSIASAAETTRDDSSLELSTQSLNEDFPFDDSNFSTKRRDTPSRSWHGRDRSTSPLLARLTLGD